VEAYCITGQKYQHLQVLLSNSSGDKGSKKDYPDYHSMEEDDPSSLSLHSVGCRMMDRGCTITLACSLPLHTHHISTSFFSQARLLKSST